MEPPRRNSERTHWLGLLDFINDLLTNPHIEEKNMGNRFVSFLQQAGRLFARGLMGALHIAEGPGAAAMVRIFAPQFGPAFNATVEAIVMAEQKYAAMGKQDGTGQQKLADVLQISEPVIAQLLADAGKANDRDAVIKYINAIVTVLNAAPAPQLN